MEKRNVETWNCTGCGPVTRVSSCYPGLRRGTPRRPRWRSDGRRRVPQSSNKRWFVRTEQRCCGPLRPALGVLRPGVRKVHGRRWSVASLRIKPKKERLKPLFFCSTLSMPDNRLEYAESSRVHILQTGFLLAAPVGGPRTTAMSRSPLRTSGCGYDRRAV